MQEEKQREQAIQVTAKISAGLFWAPTDMLGHQHEPYAITCGQ
jgi:hypothetical protein